MRGKLRNMEQEGGRRREEGGGRKEEVLRSEEIGVRSCGIRFADDFEIWRKEKGESQNLPADFRSIQAGVARLTIGRSYGILIRKMRDQSLYK